MAAGKNVTSATLLSRVFLVGGGVVAGVCSLSRGDATPRLFGDQPEGAPRRAVSSMSTSVNSVLVKGKAGGQ
jgi:hypothetical protein